MRVEGCVRPPVLLLKAEPEPAAQGAPGPLAAQRGPRGPTDVQGSGWRHLCGQASGTWRGCACTVSIYCWAVATSPWKPTGRTSHVTAEHLQKAFPSPASFLWTLLPGAGQGKHSWRPARIVGGCPAGGRGLGRVAVPPPGVGSADRTRSRNIAADHVNDAGE